MKLFKTIGTFLTANGITSLLHLGIGIALWIAGWFDAFAFLLGWFVCRNWNIVWDRLGLGAWVTSIWFKIRDWLNRLIKRF